MSESHVLKGRLMASDEQTQAAAQVELFALAESLESGILGTTSAYAAAHPYAALAWGGVDVLQNTLTVLGGKWLLDEINGNDDHDSADATVPLPAGTTVNGDVVSIQAGGNVEYNRAVSQGEGPATAQ